ncbi:hypothetical protein ES708_30240 [subsurface metagenome]
MHQVPILINAQFLFLLTTGIPATAEGVSCVAGAITGMVFISNSLHTLLEILSISSPGIIISGNISLGRSNLSNILSSHLPSFWLNITLVVILVYSL